MIYGVRLMLMSMATVTATQATAQTVQCSYSGANWAISGLDEDAARSASCKVDCTWHFASGTITRSTTLVILPPKSSVAIAKGSFRDEIVGRDNNSTCTLLPAKGG